VGGVRNKATASRGRGHHGSRLLDHQGPGGNDARARHSRGWLDYEERVSTYWPEFAQQGKERITVRQLLAHQAGLFAFDEQADRSLIADLDRLAVVLARQKPAWEAGTRQAYHAISLGYYESELLRRVDPQHRSLGSSFRMKSRHPGARLLHPSARVHPESRLATLASPSLVARLLGFPFRFTLTVLNPRANIVRALAVPCFATTRSAFTPATSRCRRAGVSAQRVPSLAPTVCSRPATGA